MPFVVTAPCAWTKDLSCVPVCPVDCFYEDELQLYIHPDECIDCGACIPECPVGAIYEEENVPPQWHGYISRNAALRERPLPKAQFDEGRVTPSHTPLVPPAERAGRREALLVEIERALQVACPEEAAERVRGMERWLPGAGAGSGGSVDPPGFEAVARALLSCFPDRGQVLLRELRELLRRPAR